MSLSLELPAAEPVSAIAATGDAEAGLVRDTLNGKARAFDDIVRANHRRVFNFVYHLTRHHQDAEDLTQQTFIKAFNGLARFDQSRPLINWLLTIARHATLNHFRDTKRWEEMPAHAAGQEPSPACAAEERDRETTLWENARAVLSRREFEILWLRFGEDLSIKETARIVGLTETHVKVLVFRARRTLLKKEQSL